jgi:hypothetical protein
MEIIDPESSGLTNEVSGRLSFFTRDEHEHKDDSSASALPTPNKVIQCLRDTFGFSRFCSLLIAPSLAPLSVCERQRRCLLQMAARLCAGSFPRVSRYSALEYLLEGTWLLPRHRPK